MLGPVHRFLAALVISTRACVALWTNFLHVIDYLCTSVHVVYHLVVDPVFLEYHRLVSVFYPTPIVWYSSYCVKSGVYGIGGNVLDSIKHFMSIFGAEPVSRVGSESLLFRLQRYASDENYENRVCVAYTNTREFFVTMTCIFLLAFGGYVVYSMVVSRLLLKDPVGRVWMSKYIAFLISITKQPFLDVSTIRSLFCSCLAITPGVPNNHSHPVSAGIRNASVETIELICARLGLRPYLMQQSKSDIRRKRAGMRSYFWGKDMGVAPTHFHPDEDDVIVLIDVDMYLDMPQLIGSHVHPYMISTFQPTTVCSDKGNSGEFSFTFDEHSNVKYVVSGGATYEHPVWNYSGDLLTVTARVWYGFGVRTTTYNIDRRQIGEHHQIVCLTPAQTFVHPLFNFTSWLLGDNLTRLEVSCGEFLRMKIKTKDGTLMSTGLAGQLSHATISMTDDDTIANMVLIGKVDLSLAQVKGVLDNTSNEEASILVAYHRSRKVYIPACVYPVSESVMNYQFDPKSYDPEAALGEVPFMNPLLLNCYVPVRSRSNDEATINGRILEVKPPDDLELTSFDLQLMNEFAEFLVPQSVFGKGIPVDIDEVYVRQNRPTQRRLLDAAVNSISNYVVDVIKCFQKAESYTDIKDPRNISTIPSEQKLHYSQFMYAFVDDILKKMPWYAFGLTPAEIANRVAYICLKANTACNTDLSRFDGRVSKILRMLEGIIINRWVHPDFKRELTELAQTQHNQIGVTKFGVKFETGFSRLSGSPETSSFNTLDNAFMGYKGLRMTRVNGLFRTDRKSVV